MQERNYAVKILGFPRRTWTDSQNLYKRVIGSLAGFYGISPFVDYLMPHLSLYKIQHYFKKIQFSRSPEVWLSKTFIIKAIHFNLTVLIKKKSV